MDELIVYYPWLDYSKDRDEPAGREASETKSERIAVPSAWRRPRERYVRRARQGATPESGYSLRRILSA